MTTNPAVARWATVTREGEERLDASYLATLTARGHQVQQIARWFRTDHLPPEALHSDVARAFQAFTLQILDLIQTDSPEVACALEKLLEAKDAAVRAAMS